MSESSKSYRALIMAGGRGTRLDPATFRLPKTLLPLRSTPIIELILAKLANEGCRQVTVAVGHLGYMIEAYCRGETGCRLPVDFLHEERSMGTFGALGLLQKSSEPLLIMNGDVLTDLSLRSLWEFHASVEADLTIAGARERIRSEYGVIRTNENGSVVGFDEKPEFQNLVSMGIYVVSARALNSVGQDERLDFPDFLTRLLSAGGTVKVFEHQGNWIDVGSPKTLALATKSAWLVSHYGGFLDKLADPTLADII